MSHLTDSNPNAGSVEQLDDALAGTPLQRFAPDLHLFVTWNGSATFLVYGYEGGRCRQVDVFSTAEPVGFDEAVALIDEHFAELRAGDES